jgi:hypothetical protein
MHIEFDAAVVGEPDQPRPERQAHRVELRGFAGRGVHLRTQPRVVRSDSRLGADPRTGAGGYRGSIAHPAGVPHIYLGKLSKQTELALLLITEE